MRGENKRAGREDGDEPSGDWSGNSARLGPGGPLSVVRAGSFSLRHSRKRVGRECTVGVCLARRVLRSTGRSTSRFGGVRHPSDTRPRLVFAAPRWSCSLLRRPSSPLSFPCFRPPRRLSTPLKTSGVPVGAGMSVMDVSCSYMLCIYVVSRGLASLGAQLTVQHALRHCHRHVSIPPGSLCKIPARRHGASLPRMSPSRQDASLPQLDPLVQRRVF